MNSFFIVEAFERAVAEFAGARYAVAVNSGTNALFLSLKFVRTQGVYPSGPVTLPARTFISVPMMCLHAGAAVTVAPGGLDGVRAAADWAAGLTGVAPAFFRNGLGGGPTLSVGTS